MPHTHHSHSGSFCMHADPTSTLEVMIATARSKGMSTMCLTEHVPRLHPADIYPEEAAAGVTLAALATTFETYVREAKRCIAKNDEGDATAVLSKGGMTAADDRGTVGLGERRGSATDTTMEILLGFEAEWIRPEADAALIRRLREEHGFDMFIGSVHFVHAIPIDFSRERYVEARDRSGGTDDKLLADYFDAQLEMLRSLKPTIVGHFDLARLMSDRPDLDLRERGEGVWAKVVRNLSVAKEEGSLIEVNTSAWRKGLDHAYPRREVLEQWLGMGGRVVLSDDSHAVAHVGTNYDRLLAYLEDAGVKEVSFLTRGVAGIEVRAESLEELRAHRYWNGNRP